MKLTLLTLITAASAATIDVKVGSGGLNFQPDSFTANEGDTVVFHFYSGSGSHSVALSSFDTPCQPASNGFYSGTIMGNSAGDHTFTIPITSTTPQWIYCSVGSHCQNGMVAVINPPSSSSQNITAYISSAMNAMRAGGSPGEVQGGVVATGASSPSPSSPPSTSGTAVGGGMASPRPSLSAGSSSGSGSGSAMTTGGGSSSAPASTTSATGAASAGTTTTRASGTGTPASSSPSVAATSTSGGQKSEWSVVLGLTVVVGGLVALMS